MCCFSWSFFSISLGMVEPQSRVHFLCCHCLVLMCHSYALHFFWKQKLLSFLVTIMKVTHTHIYFVGKENFCLIHVSLVPVLGVVGEQVNNSSSNGNDGFCLSHLLFIHEGKNKLYFSSILSWQIVAGTRNLKLFFFFPFL